MSTPLPRTETWVFRFENANTRGMITITMPLRSSLEAVRAKIAKTFPGCSISRLGYLGEDQ